MISRRYEVIRRRGGSGVGSSGVVSGISEEELGRLMDGVERLGRKIIDGLSSYCDSVCSDFVSDCDSVLKKVGVILNTSLNLSGELTDSSVGRISGVLEKFVENNSFITLFGICNSLELIKSSKDLSYCESVLGKILEYDSFSDVSSDVSNLLKIVSKLIKIIDSGVVSSSDPVSGTLEIACDLIRSWVDPIVGVISDSIHSNVSELGLEMSDLSISVEDRYYGTVVVKTDAEGFGDIRILDNDYYDLNIINDILMLNIERCYGR